MMQQGGAPMAGPQGNPDQHFSYGGQVNGNPAMAPQPLQGYNRLGQIRGQGNWGPGSQWYQNHRMGMQGTPPMAGGGLMGALGPLGGGQMSGTPVIDPRQLHGMQSGPISGFGGGGQMQGGPAGMPMPFGGQNPGGLMNGAPAMPGGMNQQQWQHILQMMQGQQGLNPLQRGFMGQMPQ